MKQMIKKAYGKKGDDVVNMNYACVDNAIAGLVEIKVPEAWATATTGATLEERGLANGVYALARADFIDYVERVYRVEANVLFGNRALHCGKPRSSSLRISFPTRKPRAT